MLTKHPRFNWAAILAALLLLIASMTEAAGATCPCSIWPSTAGPAVAADPDAKAVELGVKFKSDMPGVITGIRFYKGSTNTGTHIGTLWDSTGRVLARATFSNETTTGWQQVNFGQPVAINANAVYVASYLAPKGHYSITQRYFANGGVDNPPLHALSNSVSPNGVYKYGGGFPTNTWNSSNYWVDVVFNTSPSADTTRPTVTAFTVPATATTLTVPITALTATDNIGVTGYLVNESSSAPLATASGWSATAPTSYTFATAGSKTLYAWAKDAAGNVSVSKSASVTITLSTTGPEPAGWYAGDMHVHRSCGGSPVSTSSIYNMMGTNNLAAVSLLADMGNGEVQNPVTDLPLVNGQDDPISTAGRIVHWDAEWHWDATYGQYEHQALGGHVVALGLNEAHQIWEEYTYPIFQWAHQQNGIAGFVHMQYLNNSIPQSLNCCIPIEYPVEVALGAADFIAEDVTGGDTAIQAYYRLLNTGFRPGFAAGTDYPCGVSELGSLLTYVQVAGGQMTYPNWIEGIKAGRTVVSRNRHNEFLNLTVNDIATPGDEIQLTGSGSVPVTITWTAKQNLTGTIELVQNGVVVASKQASVTAGTPASLTTTVDFTKSGWLAARRMGSNGHQVHTAAVFVKVNNLPIRVSAADALFYVQWMDNLLTKTSPGGAWSSYFVNSRSAAQARYQAAKAIYRQIADEAGGGEPAPTGTIFTTQVPTTFDNDASYELGTRFWADVAGQITAVRLYTNAAEAGNHTVRIWRATDRTLMAGPFTWNISSGTEGWKTFTLPTPLQIAANTDYIVAISNSSDLLYAEQAHGFDAPIVNGHLHTYVGSGVYATSSGTMPVLNWNNSNYFRDVMFVPSIR